MKISIRDLSGKLVQTIDLEQGSYLFEVSEASTRMTKQNILQSKNLLKDSHLTSLLLSFAVGYALLDHFLININPRDISTLINNFLRVALFFVVGSAVFSLLSKVLTGKFKVWKSANLILCGLLGAFFISENLLGLRWLLPRFFWLSAAYNTFWLVAGALFFWFSFKTLFEHMNASFRGLIVLILVLAGSVFFYMDLIPLKDTYKYTNIETAPPRAEILESKPMNIDQFFSLIESDK